MATIDQQALRQPKKWEQIIAYYSDFSALRRLFQHIAQSPNAANWYPCGSFGCTFLYCSPDYKPVYGVFWIRPASFTELVLKEDVLLCFTRSDKASDGIWWKTSSIQVVEGFKKFANQAPLQLK